MEKDNVPFEFYVVCIIAIAALVIMALIPGNFIPEEEVGGPINDQVILEPGFPHDFSQNRQ